MLAQGPQGAAGRAERGAARVGEGPAPDGVVLERAGLATRAEVRIGRRLHRGHARVVGVQVRVIHLIHRRSASDTHEYFKPDAHDLRIKNEKIRLGNSVCFLGGYAVVFERWSKCLYFQQGLLLLRSPRLDSVLRPLGSLPCLL